MCLSRASVAYLGIPFRTSNCRRMQSRSKNFTRPLTERTPHRSSACCISCTKRRKHRGLRMASACAQSFKADRFPHWLRASTTPIRFSRQSEKARPRGRPVFWSGPTPAHWTMKPQRLTRFARRSKVIRHGRGCRTSKGSVICSPLGCCRGSTSSRGNAIRVLGVLWTRDNSGRRLSMPEMQSRSRVSAWIRDARHASRARRTAGVLGRFRRNHRQAAYARCSAAERPWRTRQLRRPGAHFMLSDRLVDAAVPE